MYIYYRRIPILCDVLYLHNNIIIIIICLDDATSTRDDCRGVRALIGSSRRAVSGPKINSTVRAVGQQEVKSGVYDRSQHNMCTVHNVQRVAAAFSPLYRLGENKNE